MDDEALIAAVAASTGQPADVVRAVLSESLATISRTIADDGFVVLDRFGLFDSFYGVMSFSPHACVLQLGAVPPAGSTGAPGKGGPR